MRKRSIGCAANAVAKIIVMALVLATAARAEQGPPDGLAVRILSPLPIPITGSASVTGTVAATQSGPWAVGATQSGTWTVNANVLSLPSVGITSSLINPIATYDASKSASSIVEIVCGTTLPGSLSGACILSTSGAANGGAFTVPSGMNLVIQTVSVQPELPPSSGYTWFRLLQSVSSGLAIREVWTVQNTQPVTQLQFSPGIVVASGSQLQIQVPAKDSTCPDCRLLYTTINGYLTAK